MDPQADWYIHVSAQSSEKTTKTRLHPTPENWKEKARVWQFARYLVCLGVCLGMTDDGYCFMVIEYGLGFSNFKDLA